jgi:bifunctional ADP-heptose synthase (sugar kinase/adenylyltransferase)
MTDEGLSDAAKRSKATELRCGFDHTWGQGMMLLGGGYETVYVGTAAREVYDVTGASDTVIAALAAALPQAQP